MSLSTSFIFFQNYFGYTGSPGFPHQLKDQLVNSCKDVSWNFDGDYTEFVDLFQEYCKLCPFVTSGLQGGMWSIFLEGSANIKSLIMSDISGNMFNKNF